MTTIYKTTTNKRVRFVNEVTYTKPRVKVSKVYNPRLTAIHDAREAFSKLNKNTFPILYTGSDYTRKDLEMLEPGYTKSIENAYIYIKRNIGTLLTPDSILRIQEICTKHLNLQDKEKDGFQINTQYHPGIPSSTLLKELEEEMTVISFKAASENNIDPTKYLSFYHSEMGIVSTSKGDEDARARISERISIYKEDIKHAKNNDEKLIAIAKFLRALTMFQGFRDGNKRTYLVLLTKLLIEERFSPAFLEDNQLFSKLMLVSDMAEKIREGIEAFKKITSDL